MLKRLTRDEEVLQLHLDTHATALDKLGPAHPMTMFAQQNVVESLKDAERSDEAKALLDVSNKHHSTAPAPRHKKHLRTNIRHAH